MRGCRIVPFYNTNIRGRLHAKLNPCCTKKMRCLSKAHRACAWNASWKNLWKNPSGQGSCWCGKTPSGAGGLDFYRGRVIVEKEAVEEVPSWTVIYWNLDPALPDTRFLSQQYGGVS